MLMKIAKAALIAVGLLSGSSGAQTQAWPEKPLRIVVPYLPGGMGDNVMRAFAPRLSHQLGQPVIVENRPGGSQIVGALAVANAPADGYTLFLASPTSLILNPMLRRRPPYDLKNFDLVSLVFESQFVLVVGSQLPVHSVADLIALAKAKPGSLNYGSIGEGSTSHLAGELFKQLANVEITHVPYKGSAGTNPDLLNGNLQLVFDASFPSAMPLVRDGRLRALAVSGSRRAAVLPDVPTMAEAGLPGFTVRVWFGLAAPAGTPQPVVRRLAHAIAEAVKDSTMRERFIPLGIEFDSSTPTDFARLVHAETDLWGRLVARLGIKLE